MPHLGWPFFYLLFWRTPTDSFIGCRQTVTPSHKVWFFYRDFSNYLFITWGMVILLVIITVEACPFSTWLHQHIGPRPPHCWNSKITLRHTTLGRTPWTSDRRFLPDNTQLSEETDTDNHNGIRTRNPSKRAAADPPFRPRGHWHRQVCKILPQTLRNLQHSN
jgi:hypothetical protein